jgi:soluble lytic murein transglycosylase-like protein
MLPGKTADQSRDVYKSQLGANAYWQSIGDDKVALVTPQPGMPSVIVKDRFGRPYVYSHADAIQAGKTGQMPPDTVWGPRGLQTPEGHPVPQTNRAIAAAATVGAVASHAAGADPNLPSFAAEASGPQAVAPAVPAPAAASPPQAQAAPAAPPTGGLNITQSILKAVNASPETQALFAGPEGGATAPSVGSAASPSYYQGLGGKTEAQIVQSLLPGVIRQEHGAGGAVSPAGASGLMQIMPATARQLWSQLYPGKPFNMETVRTDDTINRAMGTAYLTQLVHHNMTGVVPMAGIALALAEYNGGPGRVEGGTDPRTGVHQPGWLTTIGDPRSGKISIDDWVARIPIKETREYVQAVLGMTSRRLASAVGSGPNVGQG